MSQVPPDLFKKTNAWPSYEKGAQYGQVQRKVKNTNNGNKPTIILTTLQSKDELTDSIPIGVTFAGSVSSTCELTRKSTTSLSTWTSAIFVGRWEVRGSNWFQLDRRCSGGEISGEPPLPVAVGRSWQREQDGLSQVASLGQMIKSPQQISASGSLNLIPFLSCGNLVKQKYLKIHQKNHCVGIRTSTFANFRTAVNKVRMPN